MDFDAVLVQVQQQLESERRVAYRILKRRFQLDDEDIEYIKADLIDAKQMAVDEDGKVLVWTGGEPSEEMPAQTTNSAVAEPLAFAPSLQLKREAPVHEFSQKEGLPPQLRYTAALGF